MSFSLTDLLLITLGFLGLLFAIAYATDRGWIAERVARHPAVYILSLGAFTSTFALFGVTGQAFRYGNGFLYFYIGVSATFFFAPLLLVPLLRLCQTYQLTSLPDLLTFRYRSQAAGSLVTAFMLMALLPLLALQIQAVTDTAQILASSHPMPFMDPERPRAMALIFCCAITLFTVMFGSSHLKSQGRHNGLVVAIAFQSLLILATILLLGAVVVFGIFDGLDALGHWLQDAAPRLQRMQKPMAPDTSRALLLMFFALAVCMPHMFHLVFVENPSLKAMQTATWGLPLFLLLLSLPVLPIMWGGVAVNSPLPPPYFAFAPALTLNVPALAALVFVAGLAAATGAVAVSTLALANMTLNHLILPFYQPGVKQDIYRWVVWLRRLLMAAIILAGYACYQLTSGRSDLPQLSMSAFVAALQFLPGVLGVLFWPRANRVGLLGGLLVGAGMWFVTQLLPFISDINVYGLFAQLLPLTDPESFWTAAALLSLGLNGLTFTLLSGLSSQSPEERATAEACTVDDLNRPVRQRLKFHSAEEMQQRLSAALGPASAEREVQRALKELELDPDERRPFALRRLRDRIQANLSGLLGPLVAHDMVNRLLPYLDSPASEDINLIEQGLENRQVELTGLAEDLNSLRRFYRQTLQELPIGLCSLGRDREVLMWNLAMEKLTGIPAAEVVGAYVGNLPEPWNGILDDFFHGSALHRHKLRVNMAQHTRWLNLHKATTAEVDSGQDGQVIVVEDITDVKTLEDELLHSERLASIGRLAAGVAHEIGNPVTGIACLVQNLRDETEAPDTREAAADILRQTERISRIVQTLVHFAHGGREQLPPPDQAINLRQCIDEAIHLVALNKDAKVVQFNNYCPPEFETVGDNQRLLQLFVNLFTNARDASEENGSIEIDCGRLDGQLYITVTDYGSGIAAEHMEQVFEPFFTTKDPGRGTGLGLALVYSIVEEMAGQISFESPLQEGTPGTRVHLRLPLGRIATKPAAVQATGSDARG